MSLTDRIRNRPQLDVNGNVARNVKKFGAFILVTLLALYIVLGSALFLHFEHDYHENTVRKWHLNQAVNRRQQARLISTRIFNDTKNLLIIIDRDQTERVQGLLVNSLKQYEGQLHLDIPDREEWDFLHSVNYAWSMLITLGNGVRSPQTTGGQIFAFFYGIIGVPLFFGTIAVLAHKILRSIVLVQMEQIEKKCLLLLVSILLYVAWLLLIAFYLYHFAITNSFWQSFYTAVMSSFTIQTPTYNKLSECAAFFVLTGTTVAITLAIFILFLIASVYGQTTTENRPVMMDDENESKSTSPKSNDPPKFMVIVDEAGDSKLANVDD